jgi:hypothetical protein
MLEVKTNKTKQNKLARLRKKHFKWNDECHVYNMYMYL